MMLTRCHQYAHVSHTVGDASSPLGRLRLLWAREVSNLWPLPCERIGPSARALTRPSAARPNRR